MTGIFGRSLPFDVLVLLTLVLRSLVAAAAAPAVVVAAAAAPVVVVVVVVIVVVVVGTNPSLVEYIPLFVLEISSLFLATLRNAVNVFLTRNCSAGSVNLLTVIVADNKSREDMVILVFIDFGLTLLMKRGILEVNLPSCDVNESPSKGVNN